MPTNKKTTSEEWEELREKLADIEHQRWSDWHRYCRLMWTPENVERWDIQAETPYVALTEKEKDSDREQVDRYFSLLKEFTFQKQKEAIEAVLPEMADHTDCDDKMIASVATNVWNTCCKRVIQNAREKLNLEIK